MTPSKALLLALFLALPAAAAGAVPGPAVATAHLDARGAPECAGRGDVVGRVLARSPHIRFVDDAALAVQVVFKAPRPDTVVGEIVMSRPGGKPSSRRVLARSCADAADAVALIIAVTLDPTASEDDRFTKAVDVAPESAAASTAASSTSPSSGSSASRTPSPAVPAITAESRVSSSASSAAARTSDVEHGLGAAARTEPAVSAKREVAPTKKPEEPATAGSVRTTRILIAAHLAGQTIFGPAPTVMPGLSVDAIAGLERDALWSPAVVLGATRVWRSGLAEPGGTASFTLTAAELGVCPIRARLYYVEARPCAAVLAGRFTAAGTETDNGATLHRFFAVTGASALMTARLGSVVEASLQLGMGATLLRYSSEFGSTTFHQSSRITTAAGLGVGARLP